MTLPLLDIWRTLGRNRGTDVSFAALGGVYHRRQEAHVQDVPAILQQLRHWEVLREGQKKQERDMMNDDVQQVGAATAATFPSTYISAEHIVCRPEDDSVQTDGGDSVDLVEHQEHLLLSAQHIYTQAVDQITSLSDQDHGSLRGDASGVQPQACEGECCGVGPVVQGDPAIQQVVEPEIRILKINHTNGLCRQQGLFFGFSSTSSRKRFGPPPKKKLIRYRREQQSVIHFEIF